MKTATIRDLRNSFPIVAKWIEEGESVEITRSGKPFAQLAPIQQATVTSAQMPDFLARMKEYFPNESVGIAVPVMDYDRGDR